MKHVIVALMLAGSVLLAWPARALAQPPDDEPTVSFRGYGLLTAQHFAAQDTFDAVFGSARGTFVGGGIEVVHSSGIFADLEISHTSKTGQRAFVQNGQAYQLGIALEASMTPIDVLAGYRFRLGSSGRYTLYAAAGATSFGYKETSDFSDPSEDIDTRKTGVMVLGGVEVRAMRMLSVSADVANTRVTGILGSAGVSQQFGERDLGGIAARFRVIVGR